MCCNSNILYVSLVGYNTVTVYYRMINKIFNHESDGNGCRERIPTGNP